VAGAVVGAALGVCVVDRVSGEETVLSVEGVAAAVPVTAGDRASVIALALVTVSTTGVFDEAGSRAVGASWVMGFLDWTAAGSLWVSLRTAVAGLPSVPSGTLVDRVEVVLACGAGSTAVASTGLFCSCKGAPASLAAPSPETGGLTWALAAGSGAG